MVLIEREEDRVGKIYVFMHIHLIVIYSEGKVFRDL